MSADKILHTGYLVRTQIVKH